MIVTDKFTRTEHLNSKVTLYGGDNRDVLKSLPDNSLDSVVTDPPYALVSIQKRFGKPGSAATKDGDVYSRSSAGFMGKQWDTGETAFATEFWAEVYRVLKPGGHVVAFSGTRTYHRMAVAIEDAGFEIRDQLAWAYGCLDETAEILTAEGWKRGVDVAEGELVAAWSHESGEISLRPVLETFRAPFEGRLVAFQNDNTDQLLTPNHRVYARHRRRQMVNGIRSCWYDDNWTVAEAGAINRWNSIQLPLAGYAMGNGIGGSEYAALLGWVWTEGGFDKTGSGVRIYQSASANPAMVAEIQALTSRIVPNCKRYDRTREYVYGNTARDYAETCWFFTGAMADRVRADLPGKSPSWNLLWRMTAAEKEAFLDAAMKGDGSGMTFYQDSEPDLEWFQALLHLTGRQGRINRNKRCVALHNNPKTELQVRHLRHDGEEYSGDVWCVRVETGAFVARRNDLVFITGNSGFPKSHDVSKAIDKSIGHTGAIIGTETIDTGMRGGKMHAGRPRNIIERSVRKPSDLAKDWVGWGTALKPAWEPICLARKPLVGTVAENVLDHGTGAINVDGCRVGDSGGPATVAGDRYNTTVHAYGNGLGAQGGSIASLDKGRWPANITIDGSPDVLTAFGVENDVARLYYTAKADKLDRIGSKHPTVKPVDLMQWLVRLVTPKGGLVLDPFAGSGSTGEAAWREGMRCILIEREEEYQADIAERLKLADKGPATRKARAIKQADNDNLPLFGGAETGGATG